MRSVTLTLPARPEYVHIARSVAAGIAAKASMTLDDIDDIRLAVDEVCSHLIAHSHADVLRLELTPSEDSFLVVAQIDATIDDGDERGNGMVFWRILEALADSVVLERDGESSAIRMAKRIS